MLSSLPTTGFRFVAILSAFIIAGCVASGYEQAPVTSSPAAQTQKSYNGNNLLVVIRYPALYDRSQDTLFENVYYNIPLSSDPRPPSSDPYPTPFKNALIKTNYYVMEFYEALRRRLPENTVALQPQRLHIKDYTMVPSVGFEMPPAIVYVDFMTYVYTHKLITTDSNTFGHFISPLMSVRTSISGAFDTAGALVGTNGLEPKITTSVGDGANGGLGYTWVDFINDEGGEGTDYKFDVISKGPIKPGQYLELPQVNVDMGADNIHRAAATPGGPAPSASPSAEVMNSLAATVLLALDAANHETALRDEMVDYISMFDEKFGRNYTGLPANDVERGKIELIKEFITLEREFLREQDRNLYEVSYRSDFGDSVRTLLAAESQHYTDEWTNSIISSLAILGTGLASGAATGNYMPSSLWDIYFQSQDTSAALNLAFEEHFAGVRANQVEFTIKLSNKVRKIKVSDIHELRAECKIIYAEMFGGSG